MTECVHCTTQEEWNFVCEKSKWTSPTKSEWFRNYSKNSYLILDTGNYGDVTNVISTEYKVYSFDQWCKLTNNYLNNNQINNKIGMKKQMLEVLTKTYENPNLRRTTVPLFMSDPGIGKTNITEAFVREYVESKGNKMVTMVLPNLMPNEAVGGVYPNQERRVWEFYDSEKLANLKDGDCLFLDEVFNGTLKQTLDAMLNVLGQRRLGSGKKMADVMIVAASNPQGLINLTPQIKERFIRYDLKFNSDDFKEYFKDSYGIPEAISNNFCLLINKEKFEPTSWNYNSARSIEKAINQIACDLSSPYDDILIPILSATIKAPSNITSLGVKKDEDVEYIKILKLIIKNKNDKENSKQASRVTSDLLN